MRRETCQWTPDENGLHATECGHVFEFTCAGVEENEFKYCCFCGGAIVVKTNEPEAVAAESELVCPQCGQDTPTLNEGCCEPCRTGNQTRLDEHNARFDWWEKLSEAERDAQIKAAYHL